MESLNSHCVVEVSTEYEDIMQMTFSCEDEGYKFFNTYAKQKSFSIRKDKIRRDPQNGTVNFRRFICSRAGLRDEIHMNRTDRKRKERALTRCECPLEFSIQFDSISMHWRVHKFVDNHNHDLAKSDEVPFLRSHRKISDVQMSDIISLEIAGLRKHQIMSIMEHQHGSYENVGFISKDLYNFSYRNKKSKIIKGDAETVLRYMKQRQDEDVEFFYAYQTNEDGNLINLFWSDAQSRIDYDIFGDVVIFDSTYRVNRYKMPFIPFVGSNHHRSTLIFGCGIISDETIESYKWLLATFLKAMYQKSPTSIITDGDNAMREAIRTLLPNTNHRLCTWHIERNMSRYLYHSVLNDFRKLLYDECTPKAFEEKWTVFMKMHKIQEDHNWLKKMYKSRTLWAAAYVQKKLFLGMKSNQRSESLNSVLHNHLDGKMFLIDLVNHYEHCISRMRRNEAQEDCKASQSIPVIKTDLQEIETAAANIYTPKIFYVVQEEIKKVSKYFIAEIIDNDDSQQFLLAIKEQFMDFIFVDCVFNDGIEKMNCSCLKLDCEGIPCCHIFVVLRELRLVNIPHCCIWKRWTRNAKSGFPSNRKGGISGFSEQITRYRNLTNLSNEVFFEASKSNDDYEEVMRYLENKKMNMKIPALITNASKIEPEENNVSTVHILDPIPVITKGAPKKRIKSFNEIRRHKCRICQRNGHASHMCPMQKKIATDHVPL